MNKVSNSTLYRSRLDSSNDTLSFSKISLIFIMLSSVGYPAAADISINPTQVVHADSQGVNSPASSMPSEILTTAQQTRQELVTVITDEDYASSKSVKRWQRIDKHSEDSMDLSWLAKLLRYLFGDDKEVQSTIDLIALLVKWLLIGALIAFILWILSRAGYLAGWINRVKIRQSHYSRIESYSDMPLPQHWETLPEHDQIPSVVLALLGNHQLTEALSVMYRGSLRWLVHSQNLMILPATTEGQCLAQIEQLEQWGNFNGANSTQAPQTYSYISQIIALWIRAAYDTQFAIHPPKTTRDNPHTSNNPDFDQLRVEAEQLIDCWHSQLPAKAQRSNPPSSFESEVP